MIRKPDPRTLAGHCIAIVDCEHKTAPTEALGIPSIRTTNIKSGRLDIDNANRVSEETYRAWSARLEPQPNDLILAREAPVGEVGIVPEGQRVCLGQRTVLIRPNPEKADPKYLLYLLLTNEMRHAMHSRAEGSTVHHLNMKDIRQLPLPELPPIEEQRAIAEVLSAYDEKIELNRRTSRTLEAMVRAVFKSWFIDLDPVRAKAAGDPPPGLASEVADLFPAALTDTPSGPVPEGWQIVDLPAAIEVNPKRKLKKGVPAPYLEMSNMPTGGGRALDWYDREFKSGSKFMDGDTLMARITPCLENGKTAFVDFLGDRAVGWGSTEYIVLCPKPPLPPAYAYFLARDPAFREHAISNMTGTSGRQRVPPSALDRYPVVVPEGRVATAFGKVATEVFALMRHRDEESQNLASARDALLPKLLSGEVRVSPG